MKIRNLKKAKDAVPIELLNEEQLTELQISLSMLGYPIGDIDGLFGPNTRNAWAEFKIDIFEGNQVLIGPDSVKKLEEKLGEISPDKKLNLDTKENTIKAIKNTCVAHGIGLGAQIAYVLATTQWETAQTFKPVKEAFWLSEDWRKRNLRYYPYYGRGYVQLTWRNNYEKYSVLLEVDLVNNFDLALDANLALFILVHGFKTGTFTGRKITDFINENKTDFINARRCINGTDHAHDIADLAENYLLDL